MSNLHDNQSENTVFPESYSLTDSQRQELDRRLQSHQEDPNAGLSWTEVKARLLQAIKE